MLKEVMTHEEFANKHGGDSIEEEKNPNKFLFSDGASCTISERYDDSGRWYNFSEPSPDISRRCQAILYYWTLRTRRTRDVFGERWQQYSDMASMAQQYRNLPMPDDSSIEDLAEQKKLVKKCERKLTAARRAYEKTPKYLEEQKIKERQEARLEEGRKMKLKLAGMRLPNEPLEPTEDDLAEMAAKMDSENMDLLCAVAGIKPEKIQQQ